ncbi:hypothetical protein AAHC03_09832 [Spirometra sp. Aus1]
MPLSSLMCTNPRALVPQTAVQRRHIAFGVILLFFSIALMISEAKRPSSAYTGYWVGVASLFPAAGAIVLGLKPNRYVLITTCVMDFVAALTCVSGAILSLVFFSIQVYAVGWLSVILTTFLLYHAFAIFGELDICCRLAMFELPEEAPEEARRRHHGENIPAPPIDFIMPNEVRKPPNYDQLSVRGDPPLYETLTPPPPSPAAPVPVHQNSQGGVEDRRRSHHPRRSRHPPTSSSESRVAPVPEETEEETPRI